MLTAWPAIFVALAYVGSLFVIASFGDRAARRRTRGTPRPLIYALSLAVYCTSWTYFGSVGLAARSGFDFLPIYIGPILMLAVGWPVLRAIVEVSKRQNITSIADFISARYGKNQMLGALVAVIAVIEIVPYISLQLKAVSFSLTTMLPPGEALSMMQFDAADDLALIVTAALACFAMLFGTRHIDTTEHQDGLILAIAVESIVKLSAFLAVGTFVTYWLMGGLGPLLERVALRPDVLDLFTRGFEGGRWMTMTLLAMFAILLLPRQFHVAVVENSSLGDVKRAAWLFPLYLVAINLFVVPIAMAGLLTLKPGVDADTFVLALPVAAGHQGLAFIAFVGGLSAATAMVIMESIALSIMVCNNLVVPIIVRRRGGGIADHGDMGGTLLLTRRVSIAVILVLAYSYYRMIGSSAALAQTGLLSFAAVAQFAPAFFGGLLWRRGTARGAMAGILVGFAIWAYTLLVPSFVDAGWLPASLLSEGPFGAGLLRPRMLFNLAFDPLTHGVLWSLAANLVAYVAVSLTKEPLPIERLQAKAFVAPELPTPVAGFRPWRTAVSVGELETAVTRFLGAERTVRAFDEFAKGRELDLDASSEADIRTLRFAEHLLASAIGVASARLVLGLLIERHSKASRGAFKLLDDASEAIQHTRDVLQSAIDHVRQGIAVFDNQLNLVSWNLQFRELLGLPAELVRIGAPLDAIVRHFIDGDEPSARERLVVESVRRLAVDFEPHQERVGAQGPVLEIRSSPMPHGGLVATFADMTDRVEAADALKRANESLERRVAERTSELVKLNAELEHARRDAEAANLGKTRFIAAASHDILQPLNAARLFTSSLVERRGGAGGDELVRNLDASLEAVEEILSTLLDISRLDAGAMKPEIVDFRLDDMLKALAIEFGPAAREKGIDLRLVPCGLSARSDRKLLRRVLQNLVSNAIKYTSTGRVLMGCRRRGRRLRIEVWDTGSGIPRGKIKSIFREFERLDKDLGSTPGLGLGLAIVERIARVLGHKLRVDSTLAKGSVFSIEVPIAALRAIEPIARAAPHRPAELAGQSVLVIDNDASILEGMQSLLGAWGMEVHAAAGGEEAAVVLARLPAPPRVVLADLHLADEDGLGVIERLCQQAGRAIPAILITADRSQSVQRRAAAAGVAYLRKPIKPASLRATLAQLLVRAEAAE